MGRRIKITAALLIAAGMLIGLAGCEDLDLLTTIRGMVDETDDGGDSTIPVTGVSLDKESITIPVGGTEQLTATVEPSDATDQSVSWSIDNESVATVDADGLVTGVAEGTATVTVTTTDGGFTAECAVTVVLPETYTVSYGANDATHGTAPEDSTEYVSGETITVADNTGGLYIDDTEDRDFIYWNTTEDGSGDIYLPGDTITVGGANIVLHAQFIGDPGPGGGYVFHDKGSYSDGWRYLEAAPASTEWESKPWGGYGSEVGAAAQGTDIGTGAANTQAIVAEYGANEPYDDRSDYAAKLCRDFGDEWFLPSQDELDGMYNNLQKNGIGGFASAVYWSSSENDAHAAWEQSFGNGYQGDSHKSNEDRVRAARAF
jgi:hypothetical protein